MDQKIDKPGDQDLADIEAKRNWVREHFTPEAQHKYREAQEKLRLLQTILNAGWVTRDDKLNLQCLGITLGDALVQELGMEWVVVTDEHGSDPAIRLPGTTVLVFPLTMISKRIERGEIVDVDAIFKATLDTVRDMARNPKYRLNWPSTITSVNRAVTNNEPSAIGQYRRRITAYSPHVGIGS